jgi:RNA polymerase sigma-70 factor, ECF subfamily
MTHLVSSAESSRSAVINLDMRNLSLDQSIEQTHASREIDVVAAARAGSPTAIDELQRLYSARLFRTILRITKNREDAEDALQDAFLRAYMALGCFEGRSSVYSWLTRIAINSALMVIRKRRSRPDALLISSFEEENSCPSLEIRDSASNPEQVCDLRQRRTRLLQAIRTLDRLRASIEIQLAGELSMKEIADTLNISVAAVKARLYRARHHHARRVSIHSRGNQRMPACGADCSASKPVGFSHQPREQAIRILASSTRGPCAPESSWR